VIASLAEHPDRVFANKAAWTAHLDRGDFLPPTSPAEKTAARRDRSDKNFSRSRTFGSTSSTKG